MYVNLYLDELYILLKYVNPYLDKLYIFIMYVNPYLDKLYILLCLLINTRIKYIFFSVC